jgi:hypothetical protein
MCGPSAPAYATCGPSTLCCATCVPSAPACATRSPSAPGRATCGSGAPRAPYRATSCSDTSYLATCGPTTTCTLHRAYAGSSTGGARGLCSSCALYLWVPLHGSTSSTTVTGAVSASSISAHTASAAASTSTSLLSGGVGRVPPTGHPSGSSPHPSHGDSAGDRGSSVVGSLHH